MRKLSKLGLSLAIIATLSLSGCGGSSSSDDNTTAENTTVVKSGKFIDSQVSGIEYSTSTQHGITDENGSFSYIEGETVTFKIGGITLGNTQANDVITPLDTLGVTSAQSKNAVDMFIMLQSLDADNNNSNGIQISANTLESSNSMSVDFTQENLIDMSSILIQFGISSSNIKSEIDAKKHFTSSILSQYSNANDTLTTDYLNSKTFYTKSFVDSSGDYYYRYSKITYTNNHYTVKEYNDYSNGRVWEEYGEDYTISNNAIIGGHTNATLVKIQDKKLILLESYGYPESWGAQIEEYWTTKPSGFPAE